MDEAYTAIIFLLDANTSDYFEYMLGITQVMTWEKILRQEQDGMYILYGYRLIGA